MITGRISFDRLLDIARLSAIFHLRPADKPIALTGSVNSADNGLSNMSKRMDEVGGKFEVDS